MITFNPHSFPQLTLNQLYALLSLRSEVFVVEQNCVYQDLDEKDKSALHLLGMENSKLVAYLRLFSPMENNHAVVFGRVVVAKSVRKKGYGKKLIQEMLNYCDAHFPGVKINCSAQLYLKHFYESFGFHAVGDAYDEDGIPHIKMVK